MRVVLPANITLHQNKNTKSNFIWLFAINLLFNNFQYARQKLLSILEISLNKTLYSQVI